MIKNVNKSNLHSKHQSVTNISNVPNLLIEEIMNQYQKINNKPIPSSSNYTNNNTTLSSAIAQLCQKNH
jgi:hypothetical protein